MPVCVVAEVEGVVCVVLVVVVVVLVVVCVVAIGPPPPPPPPPLLLLLLPPPLGPALGHAVVFGVTVTVVVPSTEEIDVSEVPPLSHVVAAE